MQRFHKLWETRIFPLARSLTLFPLLRGILQGPPAPLIVRKIPSQEGCHAFPAVDASHSLPRRYSTSPLDAFGHRVSVHCSEMPDQNDMSVDRTFKQASSVFV
ncbi:hypothetical protein BKA83DRAFT_4171826, partial [Pisolithus microcarpus]